MNPSCRTAAGGALALAMICSFAGCKGVSQTTSAETRKSAQHPNAVQAQPALLKQLVIGEPVHAMVSATLRVAGRVEADETRQARVSSPVTGRIVDLDVVEAAFAERPLQQDACVLVVVDDEYSEAHHRLPTPLISQRGCQAARPPREGLFRRVRASRWGAQVALLAPPPHNCGVPPAIRPLHSPDADRPM